MSSLLTLYGNGIGQRAVVGRAALLSETEDRMSLDPQLLAQVARRERVDGEPLEIILVAESAVYALLMPLPEKLRIIGLVAEREEAPGILPGFPMLLGVTAAREKVEEGFLLLLDPQRKQVLVEPDAREIVRLQAETHRPRVRVGSAQVAAVTQAGRQVAVWTFIRDVAEIDAALIGGADGILVMPGGDLLPGDQTSFAEDTDLTPQLLTAADRFGGGEIALAASPEMLDPAVIVRVASRCLLRWAVPGGDLPVSSAGLREELENTIALETEAGRLAAMPLLAAFSPALDAPDTAQFEEIFVPAEAVADLAIETVFSLPPIRAVFDNPFDDSLPGLTEVVLTGVTGIVVPLSRIAEAKDRIRSVDDLGNDL